MAWARAAERERGRSGSTSQRVLDLAVAVPALLLLSPVLGTIAVVVRLRLGSPVLFRQERPGLKGRPFVILKFRTMTTAGDAEGRLLPDVHRRTRVGRFLRRTSLDELPELINVLKGDMSLVGPRPLLMQYLERYTPEQMRRHDVRPGITGWSQVNGRNALSWEEKFELDVWYVEHRSIRLDVKTLARTIGRIVTGHGVDPPGSEAVEEFMGSPGAPASQAG